MTSIYQTIDVNSMLFRQISKWIEIREYRCCRRCRCCNCRRNSGWRGVV